MLNFYIDVKKILKASKKLWQIFKGLTTILKKYDFF